MTKQPSTEELTEEFQKITTLINFQEKISSDYIARIRKKERLIKYLNQYIGLYESKKANQNSINSVMDNDQDVIALKNQIEIINNERKDKEEELKDIIKRILKYPFVEEKINEKQFTVKLDKASEFFDFLVEEYLLENEHLRIKDQIYGREVSVERMKDWEKTQAENTENKSKTSGAGMFYKMSTEDGRRSELYVVPDGFQDFKNLDIPYVIYDEDGKNKIERVNWKDHTKQVDEFISGESKKIVLKNGGSKFSHLPAYDICILPQSSFSDKVEFETIEDEENGQKKIVKLGYRTYCTTDIEENIEDVIKKGEIKHKYKIQIQVEGNTADCEFIITESTTNEELYKDWEVGKTNKGRIIYDTIRVIFKSKDHPGAKVINRLGKTTTQYLDKLTPKEDGTTEMILIDKDITYTAEVPTNITDRETRRVIFTHKPESESDQETLIYTTVAFYNVNEWKQKCVEAQGNNNLEPLNAFITSKNNNSSKYYGFLVCDESSVKNYECPIKSIPSFNNEPIPVELGIYLKPNQKVWRMVRFHGVNMTKGIINNDYYISFGEQVVTIDLDIINNNGFKNYNIQLGEKLRTISFSPEGFYPGRSYDYWIGWDDGNKKIELVRLTLSMYDREKKIEITKDNFISNVGIVLYKEKYSTTDTNKSYSFSIKGSLANGNPFNIEKDDGLIEVWKNTKLNDYKLLRYYVGDTVYYRVFHFVPK